MAVESQTKDVSSYQLNADSGDRFGFGFFIALAIHLILIFGVVFKWVDTDDQDKDLDVTLVTHYSNKAPDEADFLAQSNQEASGTKEEVRVPTSPNPESRTDMWGEQGTLPSNLLKALEGVQADKLLTTTNSAERERIQEQTHSGPLTSDSLAARQSLLARLDMLQQEYAKRPKIGALTSVAAKAREDAEYQMHLQERVIEIGNQNYPRESLEQGLFGSLRMMLTILPDGSLESTEITESSGHQLLDRAAVNIARLSAPFQPFSKELSAKYDKILFIRTWQFLPGGRLATEG